MRYYVTTDVHGYFTELKNALEEKGFFNDPEPHKLIICGDLFDRGQEAQEMQKFIMELLLKNQVILIRGNHEDLTMELLQQWENYSFLSKHHWQNGTIDTVCQLIGYTQQKMLTDYIPAGRALLHTSLVQSIIPATRYYFETDKYIFVHGWIPCGRVDTDENETAYLYEPNWRDASNTQWRAARWCNGMEAAHCGVIEDEKTIVCGHWNCSFGHSHYHGQGSEFEADAHFEPYYDKGIIALDACTAYTHKVNCIVIED